jgi:hypothetical protein
MSNGTLPIREALRQKIVAYQETRAVEIDQTLRKKFADTFPEIAHHVDDTELRLSLIDIEYATWPRGNKFRDNARRESVCEFQRSYVRQIALSLLDRDPPLTDDVAIFLELYLVEKNVI